MGKLWDDKKIGAMWDVIQSAGNAAKAAADKAKAEEAAAKAKAKEEGAKLAGAKEVVGALVGALTSGTGKNICPPCPTENGKSKWAGWKRALDDELKNAGGELTWKKLRQ